MPPPSPARLSALCRWLGLAAFLVLSAASLPAATLLKSNFEGANPWTGMAGYSTTAGGAVTATPTYGTTAGTIDAYGSATPSAGLLLTVNSSAATGAWTAGVRSGVLSLLTANTRGAGFLTLSFSLSASSAYPVRVRIESFDNAATPARTGGLSTLIFPAAPDFYQRYALDLDKMIADGAGTFVPTAPKVQITFELDSTANGTGWPAASAHSLQVDNVNLSTPKYYVKPGGAGTQDGLTEANALATIQAAVNKTFSGDNIIAIMDDGVAGGVDYNSSNVNGDMVNISKPGTPDAWIVFKNYPGHSPVLKNNGWDAFRICNNTSGGSAAYIEVRGLTIRGNSFVDANGDRQIDPAYQQYVGLVDSRSNGNGTAVDGGFNETNRPHHVRIADNVMEYLAGGNGGGRGDRFTYENNVIRYNCWWMIYAGSGISFGATVDTETGDNYRMLIRDNVIYGNECMVPWKTTSNPYSDGNGIIIDTNTSSYTGRVLIQNNLVYNNGGSGIHVLKSSNVDIVHNTAYFNSASSSQAYGQIFTQSTGSDGGTWVKNVRVTNNVMVAQRRDVNTTNSYLFNESATGVASFDPTTIVHQRNVYVGGDNTPNLSGANLSNNADRGRAYDPANVFISPSLDPNVADFRLRLAEATSYGAAVGYRSTHDLAFTPRSLTGPTDVGAYQTAPGLAFSPVVTPKSGNYAGAQSVTLVSDTAGAKIVYTTNGTTPTVDAAGNATNGTVYPTTSPATVIPVNAATTLKAIAWKAGLTTSPVSTAIYTFQDLTTLPVTLSLETPTGIYPGTRVSQPLTRTPGALFRYTTNGTTDPTPTTGTPQDYRGYTVLDYATLRYQAYKPGRANSPVLATTITVRAQMGNTADGSTVTTFGANKVRFVRFESANNFSAANVYARLAGSAGGYRAAVYSDNAGAPNRLLASSNLVSNPAAGWTAFPLTSRASLSKTSSKSPVYYWLAVWSDNANAGIYSVPTGGTVREASSTFSSTWPAPPTPTTTVPDANVAATTAVAGTVNYAIYTMNQPPNLAPVVSAGPDLSIASGATASLNGTVSDDGVPLAPGTVTQVWSTVSGPGTVSFANATSAATTATFSVNGTYNLRLTARDALLTAADEVTVNVGTGGSGPLDPPAPAGTVRDRFSDGLGGTYPQQYPGVAGDGWAGAWTVSGTPTATVANAAPLNGGGNSLSVVRNGGNGSGLQGVYRQWSSATRPYDQFARLTFDFRLDSPVTVFNTTTDTVNVTARPTAGATPGPDSTFFIRAFGGSTPAAREWKVYNGDGNTTNPGVYNAARFVGTGMSCDPGEVYTFTVDLFGGTAASPTGAAKANGTYDVTITRASDGASVTVFGLRYRSAAYATGGYLSFSTSQDVTTDNLAFSVDSIEMTSLAATTTSLATSASRVGYGELVTFTATVATTPGGGVIPAGPVTFLDNGNVIGAGSLNESGVATLSTSALDTGTHYLTAFYPATPGYTASTSGYVQQDVGSVTAATLLSNANPANLGAPVTFSASVVSDNDIPTGAVTFYDNGNNLGTGTLDAGGTATLTTSALSVGLHSIFAYYGGDVAHSGSYSTEFIQTIQRPDGTTRVLAIDAASVNPIPGTGFDGDYGYDSGTTTATTATINTAAVSYPAPMAVYQSERYGPNLTYTLGGLNPAGAYLVRLHLSENYWGLGGRTGPGKRLMNVALNGTPRLASFDIYAAAGNTANKAVVREFAVSANASGQVIINLTTAAGSPDTNAKIDGLEVYTVTPLDAWRVANFTPAQLDNAAVSAPLADADGDGLSNLVEYALGTSPVLPATNGLPVVARDVDGHLTLTFFRAQGDVTYTVEGSGDLVNWTAILPVNPGAVGQNATVTDNAPPGVAPRFLRLRVTR